MIYLLITVQNGLHSQRQAVLFGFWPDLASHLRRSAFHPGSAFPLRWMVQGCPSLGNPFGGVKVHWTFTSFRLTHSVDYASASDRPTCFAGSTQNSEPW